MLLRHYLEQGGSKTPSRDNSASVECTGGFDRAPLDRDLDAVPVEYGLAGGVGRTYTAIIEIRLAA